MKSKLIFIIIIICIFLCSCNDTISDKDLVGSISSNSSKNSIKNIKIIDGRDFSDGVAWVKCENGWNCIDKTGKILFSLDQTLRPSVNFINGVGIVFNTKTYNGTIINKSGEIISGNADGQYDNTIMLGCYNYNGVIFVETYIDTFEVTEKRIGVIDSNGDWYIEPTSNIKYPQYCGDGMYQLDTEYYLNINTKEIVHISSTKKTKPGQNWIPIFNNGYIMTKPYDSGIDVTDLNGESFRIYPKSNTNIDIIDYGKYNDDVFFGTHDDDVFWGNDDYSVEGNFYDIYGNKVVDLSKYNIYTKSGYPYFIDGYCFLEILNPQGSLYFTIIDKAGECQFEPRKLVYRHGTLSCGLVWIQEEYNGKYSYMDVYGNILFSINCSEANDFSEDIARIVQSDETYYIDKNGKKLF